MKTEDQINEENKFKSSHQMENENTANNHKTSSTTYWMIGIWIVLILVSVGVFQHYQQWYKGQIGELKTELDQKDSTINNYMGTLNEIEATMDSIKIRKNIISNLSTGYQEQAKLGNNKKQIIEDIKYLNYLIDYNKKQIASLNRALSKSGMRIEKFEEKIKNLSKIIEENELSIADLKQQLVNKNFEIAQLNEVFNVMSEQINAQTSLIGDKQNLLNKAYIVIGTFKELEDKKIVERNGGFLWFNRTTTVAIVLEDSTFNTIDITQTNTFPVNAEKAEFISNHPVNSYEWIMNGEKIDSVKIIDTNSFWKFTRYAVLETK
jgi:uncharacterized protein Smg (DUF494 family)